MNPFDPVPPDHATVAREMRSQQANPVHEIAAGVVLVGLLLAGMAALERPASVSPENEGVEMASPATTGSVRPRHC